jgi:hypothetical protein
MIDFEPQLKRRKVSVGWLKEIYLTSAKSLLKSPEPNRPMPILVIL